MDWKVFAATFGAIFLAELGDKTQMANLCFAAQSKSLMSVFFASVLGFAAVTLLTMIFAGAVCRYVHPEHIRYGAASLFILAGILTFAGKL
ncbi:MAG: hypothetical protein GF333_03300 [Candidatus Omnitrophica bacterium]|nr:hypothetical protein [Candidatus Omnitrophota bacterium]